MKRKIIAMVLLVCLLLTSCSDTHVEKEGEDSTTKTSMFVVVEEANLWYIVYHKETKVMYWVSRGSYNCGNLYLLVNADGSPMLWEG